MSGANSTRCKRKRIGQRGEKEEFEEAHAVEGGALDGLDGTKGITKGNVQQRVYGTQATRILDSYPEDSLKHKQVKAIAKTTFGTLVTGARASKMKTGCSPN